MLSVVVVLQVVVIVMSLGFILFVTVLHIIGKVRGLGVLWEEGLLCARVQRWQCLAGTAPRAAAATLVLLL